MAETKPKVQSLVITGRPLRLVKRAIETLRDISKQIDERALRKVEQDTAERLAERFRIIPGSPNIQDQELTG